MSLLMPRMQYGGKASASVAVTGAAGLLPTEAEDQEKLVVTGEFGGGGYIAAERHALILRGVQNCLRHLGLLEGVPTTRSALGEPATVIQSAADPTGYLMAPCRGFWEATVDPMATVKKGELLGRVHNPEQPHEGKCACWCSLACRLRESEPLLLQRLLKSWHRSTACWGPPDQSPSRDQGTSWPSWPSPSAWKSCWPSSSCGGGGGGAYACSG